VPDFSTNTICFNGLDLCVVKPQTTSTASPVRDNHRHGRQDLLVAGLFAEDGRINPLYDEGCERISRNEAISMDWAA